jgi:hypothetical protein
MRASAGDGSLGGAGRAQPVQSLLTEVVDNDAARPSPEREELGVIQGVGQIEALVAVDVEYGRDIGIEFRSSTEEAS